AHAGAAQEPHHGGAAGSRLGGRGGRGRASAGPRRAHLHAPDARVADPGSGGSLSPVGFRVPGERRPRRWWRNLRGLLVFLLPPFAYQWVRYLFWYRAVLPLRRPRTFTQRLFHKMARDRDPLLCVTSDKVGLRDYVLDRLGPGY